MFFLVMTQGVSKPGVFPELPSKIRPSKIRPEQPISGRGGQMREGGVGHDVGGDATRSAPPH